MRRVAVTLCLLALIAAGCTRVADSPKAQPEQLVAPIPAGQVHDLVSPGAQGGDGNLFVTVEPQECAGVAREVDPPFISDNSPAATDGGHWTDVLDGREVFIEEMVGVFRSNYNAKDALAKARRTIEACRGTPFTVISLQEREYHFELLPGADSGSPEILLWSFKADDWACDSALTTAHNAAIEISTCGDANGYDVLSLARDALKRIEALANTTA